MSAPAKLGMVQFPAENEITQFISNYPADFFPHLYVANAFQMIASYFGKKKVHRDTIHDHVVIALDEAIEKSGNEEQKQLLKLRTKMGELKLAQNSKKELTELAIVPHLKTTYEVCELLLGQLLEAPKKRA